MTNKEIAFEAIWSAGNDALHKLCEIRDAAETIFGTESQLVKELEEAIDGVDLASDILLHMGVKITESLSYDDFEHWLEGEDGDYKQ